MLSICPYCSVGCATLVQTIDGKIVNIEGDPRICVASCSTRSTPPTGRRKKRTRNTTPDAIGMEIKRGAAGGRGGR